MITQTPRLNVLSFRLPPSHKCPQTLSTPVDLAHPQVRSPRSIFNSLSCPSVQ